MITGRRGTQGEGESERDKQRSGKRRDTKVSSFEAL